GNALDVAVEGTGFFEVTLPDGTTAFTRAGAFKLDNQSRMVTSEGIPLEPAISIPSGAEDITVGSDGVVSAILPGQSTASQVGQIQTARFANPAGLRALGKNLLQETETAGPAPDAPPPGPAPAAGGSRTLEGARVLDALRRAGADLAAITYTIPPVIRVRRASQEVSEAAVRQILERFLAEALGAGAADAELK